MGGRFQDAWQFMWSEVWLPLEQVEDAPLEMYCDLYVELAKAYRKAPTPTDFDTVANAPALARKTLESTVADQLREENSIASFLENAYDVLVETGNAELPRAYKELIERFLEARNLRYKVVAPFQIRAHIPGVFSALMNDVLALAEGDQELSEAASEFEHAFTALVHSQVETDMKTCIQKASMLVEAIASACPDARGATLADFCDSVGCWPHAAIREAVKKLYGFCSDYPGIRHRVTRKRGRLRQLEMRDSIIVPLLLLTASGYFGSNAGLMATLRSQASEPAQLPADEPAIDLVSSFRALP